MPLMPVQSAAVRQREPKRSSLQHRGDEHVSERPLAWVESPEFQGVSALVIFSNAIIIGLETDFPTFPMWFWFEQALLIFFVFELSVRLCRHRLNYFLHEDDWVWNLLDFGIVASGVSDQWVMPLLEILKRQTHDRSQHAGVVFMLMRMLRLLRIVRLFRLVKIVRPLYQLAQGVLEALQGMFWVLVFMILCTRFIGHAAALPEDMRDDEDIEPIKKMFGTVTESMFTLFGTMTSWSLIKFVPLFKAAPLLMPSFVLFYIYSAWALLAVMTGVVSENLIAIRDQRDKEETAKEERRKQNITDVLHDLFAKADVDNSKSVTRHEFNQMLKDPTLSKLLSKNSNLKVSDLYEIFEFLDNDGGGTLTIDEFMSGFKWVNEPLSTKSIVTLQERLISALKQVKDDTQETIESRYEHTMDLVNHPMRKVHAISEQMEKLNDVCKGLK
eukprot:CAMPEP_0169211874 /NCGR_PEP_ID=MMETSP1016-20121227/15986_1 /TAXON_ID=342587 /ORGANISM="Karlodinium micrum, Strain CCMP2283" /LENGTH=441 /DNA_ID=CAMNT_0009289521 /DNA_START=81 /DNA_END=1403 /DNA_ORIENTATION=-